MEPTASLTVLKKRFRRIESVSLTVPFNGKLRDQLLNGEIFYTLKQAQVVIERWRCYYNTIRPHSALGYRPPAPETTPPEKVLTTMNQAA